MNNDVVRALNEGENRYRQTVLGQGPIDGWHPVMVTCPSCKNPTKGHREGDSEYCTTCGTVLGSASTPEGVALHRAVPETLDPTETKGAGVRQPTVYLIAQPSIPRHSDNRPRDLSPLYEHGKVEVLVQTGDQPTFHPERCMELIDRRLANFDPDVDMLAFAGGDTLAAVLTGAVLASKFYDDERDDIHITWLRYERGRARDGSRVMEGSRYVPIRVPLFPSVLDAEAPAQDSLVKG